MIEKLEGKITELEFTPLEFETYADKKGRSWALH